jgi:hypothetical protein
MAGPSPAWNRNTPEKFWANVEIKGPDDCWPWKLSLDNGGYGHVGWQGKIVKTHRVAYELHHKIKLPRYRLGDPKARLVLHSCDYRSCCNPHHLWLGTHKQNRVDCVAKGRDNAARGNRNGSRTHPERLTRGDANPSRSQPEKLKRGSQHHNAFLNERQVRRIRERLAAGHARSVIARTYGVTTAVIWKIAVRRTWTHI